MSKYDPSDGYEPCATCGELTSDTERLCNLCRNPVPVKSPRRKRSNALSDHAPNNWDYTKRIHRRGYGWKKLHES